MGSICMCGPKPLCSATVTSVHTSALILQPRVVLHLSLVHARFLLLNVAAVRCRACVYLIVSPNVVNASLFRSLESWNVCKLATREAIEREGALCCLLRSWRSSPGAKCGFSMPKKPHGECMRSCFPFVARFRLIHIRKSGREDEEWKCVFLYLRRISLNPLAHLTMQHKSVRRFLRQIGPTGVIYDSAKITDMRTSCVLLTNARMCTSRSPRTYRPT
jgi:hypothetical protein